MIAEAKRQDLRRPYSGRILQVRILYIGPLGRGQTCRHRMETLQRLGHQVSGVDTTPPSRNKERWLPVRVLRRVGYLPDLASANAQALDLLEQHPYEVLWVDKGLTIAPETLRRVKNHWPSCRLVSYSGDDMLNPRNQSRRYLGCLPLYDLHVTTKSFNVPELKELGARDVLCVVNSYDSYVHRPMPLARAERENWACDVGFIGDFERERYRSMLALAGNGIKVTVRGPRWQRCVGEHANLVVKPGWVFDYDYAKAIRATKINLGFLRKVNRDLRTRRSVEIPACGGFMLAERTNEHLALFEEGKEAEFFASSDELVDKVRYYLTHEEARCRIAAAGRERCLRSGYSNEAVLCSVLARLFRDDTETFK